MERYSNIVSEILGADAEVAAQVDIEREWLRTVLGSVPSAMDLDAEAVCTRVKEIEETTRHDIVALIQALSETAGEDDSTVKRFVHLGLTSQVRSNT
ncbi:hypothetical protein KIPB_014251 [Kipferlia bialata]|uniref:Uncharacterized protein n=1 Tax=Kipferlia bialata TaxID=797122 RepID=A0A391PA07_9EUKA|nr:hypothetical protein KIPB_014251 [Kipferlia bialata]|eukprot:g14251.t1